MFFGKDYWFKNGGSYNCILQDSVFFLCKVVVLFSLTRVDYFESLVDFTELW